MSEALIDRLNTTVEPSRDLDAEIDVALFGGETTWRQANYTMDSHPATKRASKSHVGGYAFEAVPFFSSDPSASLGAVMRLCPGWAWKLVQENASFTFVLRNAAKLETVAPAWVATNSEPALAIINALVRALTPTHNPDYRMEGRE